MYASNVCVSMRVCADMCVVWAVHLWWNDDLNLCCCCDNIVWIRLWVCFFYTSEEHTNTNATNYIDSNLQRIQSRLREYKPKQAVVFNMQSFLSFTPSLVFSLSLSFFQKIPKHSHYTHTISPFLPFSLFPFLTLSNVKCCCCDAHIKYLFKCVYVQIFRRNKDYL